MWFIDYEIDRVNNYKGLKTDYNMDSLREDYLLRDESYICKKQTSISDPITILVHFFPYSQN